MTVLLLLTYKRKKSITLALPKKRMQ